MNVYGPLILKTDVEGAVTDTLKLWFPTVLAEAERSADVDPGTWSPPRSWSVVPEFAQRPGAQLPAAVVVSSGTDWEATRLGDGTYSAWWNIDVLVLTTAADAPSASFLAGLYGALVRRILKGKPGLDGTASDLEWLGEEYLDVPADFTLIGSVVRCSARVLMRGVVTEAGLPATPDLDHYAPGEVQTVTTTLERSLT